MRRRSLQGFFAASGIGVLGGLVGLGGAEFRLPVLKGWFRLASLQAVVFNKGISLVVVCFALLFRSYEITPSLLLSHIDITLNLLAGSLVGAWIAAGRAMRISEALLDRIIMVLLLALALLLLSHTFWSPENSGRAFENPWLQYGAGIVAGFGIGVVAALLGVAGGELLIPTIVLLYGVDAKLAGSLSLLVSLPTMIVGFWRYSQGEVFAVFRTERGLLRGMVTGSIVGVALGSLLLGSVSTDALLVFLALLLVLSAYKTFSHSKEK